MTRLGATSSDTGMTIGNPHLEKHIVKVVRSCRFLVFGDHSRRFSLNPTPDEVKETRFQKKKPANSSNDDIRRLFVKPRSKVICERWATAQHLCGSKGKGFICSGQNGCSGACRQFLQSTPAANGFRSHIRLLPPHD